MDELSAAEAAKWLGVSREAVDLAAREGRLSFVAGGGPRRFTRAAVEDFHQGRQDALVASLARNGETPASVARKVRAALHASGTGLPRSSSVRLAAMPEAWRSLFTRAELAAACLKDGEGCRWCKAAEFSAFLGLRPTPYAPAYAELFGGPPCGTCGPALLRPFMARLAARVHPGGVRPSVGPVVASAAERAAAQQWASRQAVTASAKPVQDDDGRSMVARRLREARTRLKDAKRRNDQAYALRMAQVVRGLEQDAARVDGRSAVTASARPGKLACGHLLAAGCGCPRRSSSMGRR
ncbi:helix-turn-helix domain-containing protein [Streptomyces sp. LBUM 1486]|uniref:helix-turn-helix domain-containing protein n=1 Tax=Streptomyces scabiei TaxID=1930 RepID=UPI001B33AC6C|nr:helix-turn-helix domain-containing protein [Streptomyces sp. LBUM 1486]MBP5915745.1 helix-turn-helix domain-containing protein [Streptomyces sp. LBUM 1486]